ncbi:MAG: GspH/FimT family protein [Anaerolineales bacterium]|nr:GspH/FimT family protein [Anaerolineales bacterium]
MSNRLTSATNEFMAALNFARSEAIKRGQSVTLCKSSTGTSCTASSNWEQGWIAFVDANANGSLDSGETVLRVWPALPAKYSLRPNNNFNNYLRYDPRGAANNLGTFAICYNNQKVGAKAIVITRLRPRLGLDSNGNKIPENDSGDITSCFTS